MCLFVSTLVRQFGGIISSTSIYFIINTFHFFHLLIQLYGIMIINKISLQVGVENNIKLPANLNKFVDKLVFANTETPSK